MDSSRRCPTTTTRWTSSRALRRADGKRQDDAPLFLLNHWLSPESSQTPADANAEEVLLPRAERCAAERGQPVNLVAVDYYDTGDLFEVVDTLNVAADGSG